MPRNQFSQLPAHGTRMFQVRLEVVAPWKRRDIEPAVRQETVNGDPTQRRFLLAFGVYGRAQSHSGKMIQPPQQPVVSLRFDEDYAAADLERHTDIEEQVPAECHLRIKQILDLSQDSLAPWP